MIVAVTFFGRFVGRFRIYLVICRYGLKGGLIKFGIDKFGDVRFYRDIGKVEEGVRFFLYDIRFRI